MKQSKYQEVLEAAHTTVSADKNNLALKLLESLLLLERPLAVEVLDAVSLAERIGQQELALKLALSDTIDSSKSIIEKTEQLLRDTRSDWPELKIVMLGNCTFTTLVPALRTGLARGGFLAEFRKGDFNVINQVLIEQDSDMVAWQPDAVIIVLEFQGIIGNSGYRKEKERSEILLSELERLMDSVETWIERTGCPVVINSLVPPRYPRLGFCDAWHPWGDRFLVEKANQLMARRAMHITGMIIIDNAEILAELGWQEWSDPKWWFYGRIPWSEKGALSFGRRLSDAILGIKSGTKKVLALDLDNTLWNGVLGEVGTLGVGVGDDYPGNAFKAFQAECLRLKALGMVIVILSKNEQDAALEVFEKHPGMLIKLKDIVAYRISWEPKPEGLKSLAGELNLGIESFVFIDDSPHERNLMRTMLPEVTVPALPEDPSLRPDFLRSLTSTWPVRLTTEDAKRSQIYKDQAARKMLQKRTKTLEDYLFALEQILEFGLCKETQLSRTAQLHQRTNQFNLTTLRLEEGEIEQMMKRDDRMVFAGAVRDRFGEQGQVLAATVSLEGNTAEILSFLMSCRTIGRGVEFAFWAHITMELIMRSIKCVKSRYLATEKNRQVKNFWETCGFKKINEDCDHNTTWEKQLEQPFPCPDYVTVALTDEKKPYHKEDEKGDDETIESKSW